MQMYHNYIHLYHFIFRIWVGAFLLGKYPYLVVENNLQFQESFVILSNSDDLFLTLKRLSLHLLKDDNYITVYDGENFSN